MAYLKKENYININLNSKLKWIIKKNKKIIKNLMDTNQKLVSKLNSFNKGFIKPSKGFIQPYESFTSPLLNL